MANNVRFSTTTLNGFLDTINTRIGTGGLLRFYDGTQPTNCDTALGAQVKLAELALTTPNPFGAASSRTITAATITADTSADATGTCGWATFVTSGGTRVMDVSVGTSGADINVNTVSFVSGANVSVSSCTISIAL